MKDLVAIVVGLGALGYGIYRFYLFVNSGDTGGTHNMWWAIGCGAVFFICALIYFLGHVNKEEEIHITQ